MIEVQRLTKKYGNLLAIDNISLHVAKGGILGLLGPNGAGKTTTMRILTGYIPASGGSVKIAGFDIQQQALQAKQSIGYLPESTPLYKQMRVNNYLEFMAELRKVPNAEIKSHVAAVIEKCQLTEVRNRVIAQLSKGFRQRAGIAQALVHNPPVLILDEPTIGLDPKQIIQVRKLIKSLRKHHSIILSTHILPEVSAVCDRVLILDKGRLIAEDTPQNLAQRIKGREKVFLQALGPAREIKAALEELDGVEKVELTDKDCYRIESNSKKDLRGKIAQLIAQNNWELQELHTCQVSLEDVFLHLTTTEEEERA